MPRIAFPFVAAGCGWLLATDANAADVADPYDAAMETAAEPAKRRANFVDRLAEWQVVIGGGGLVAPVYEGSDKFEVLPVPVVMATFADRATIDPRGLTVDIYEYAGIDLGVHVGYDLGRSEDDAHRLRGLGDVDAGAVLGAKVSYEIGPVELYGKVDRTVGGSNGFTGTVGAEISQMYGRFLVEGGLSATFADQQEMDTYFSVNRLQAARSGLRRYEASAGLKRVDLDAAVTYFVTDHWLVRGQAGLGYLVGDAADSPIVVQEAQPSAMLTVGYRF